MGTQRRYRALVAFLFVFSSAAVLLHAQAETKKPRLSGYLADRAPDLTNVIPPAPRDGDARDHADREIFRLTRALSGTPRWTLAQKDNVLSVAALLEDFSCAARLKLTTANAPYLSQLLARASTDSNAIDGVIKDQYQRKRPFLVEQGPICIDRSARLAESFDYPSGHTTLGWIVGLILADLRPERSGPLLIRARAYGESRIVCGVHNASAVEGGRTLASAIFATLQANPKFREDLEKAREELNGLAGGDKALDKSVCASQSALISDSPFSAQGSGQPGK